jgi:hypothetical protein
MRPLLCSWQAGRPSVTRSRFLGVHGTQNQFGAQIHTDARTGQQCLVVGLNNIIPIVVPFLLAAHVILIGSIVFFRKTAFDLETNIGSLRIDATLC